jgi:hypothetical protein
MVSMEKALRGDSIKSNESKILLEIDFQVFISRGLNPRGLRSVLTRSVK